MKRLFVLLLALALLLACQPTPEEEFVVNKADGELESLIGESTPVPPYGEAKNTLSDMLGVSETVQDAFTTQVYGGTLDVSVDAKVVVPEVSTVPVCTAEVGWGAMKNRTEIAHALLGDEIYEITGERVSYYGNQYEVLYYTEWLSELNDGKYRTNNPEGERYTVENNLNVARDLVRRYENAPEPIPWDGTFAGDGKNVLLWHDPFLLEFYESDGVFQFVTFTDCRYRAVNSGIIGLGRTPNTDADRAAIEVAQTLLRSVTDLETEAFAVESGYNGGTEIAFTVYRNGIPSYPLRYDHGDDMGYDAVHGDGYNRKLRPETLMVHVYNDTVSQMNWSSMLQTTGTENENVTLLAFSKILEIFKSHIRTAYYLNYDERDGSPMHAKLHITAIRLNTLRVDRPNSDGYYLLPVWDFCGWQELIDWSDDPIINQEVNQNAEALNWNSSFLTINAIDGSIIDRNLGY